jgi:hypothetical protein
MWHDALLFTVAVACVSALLYASMFAAPAAFVASDQNPHP